MFVFHISLFHILKIYISIINISNNSYFYLYINLACLSGCFSVRLYPINVKTAKPTVTKFCVGQHVTLGKVIDHQNLKIWLLNSISIKFWKSVIFLIGLFYNAYKEKMFIIEIEDGCKAPLKLGCLFFCIQ